MIDKSLDQEPFLFSVINLRTQATSQILPRASTFTLLAAVCILFNLNA